MESSPHLHLTKRFTLINEFPKPVTAAASVIPCMEKLERLWLDSIYLEPALLNCIQSCRLTHLILMGLLPFDALCEVLVSQKALEYLKLGYGSHGTVLPADGLPNVRTVIVDDGAWSFVGTLRGIQHLSSPCRPADQYVPPPDFLHSLLTLAFAVVDANSIRNFTRHLNSVEYLNIRQMCFMPNVRSYP
ncbi:hypothetical protein ONZ45_g6545 [Pleurotus djamor]|nr:hypothetical protein ONZ45_g6545 [Pleurotus djamor]